MVHVDIRGYKIVHLVALLKEDTEVKKGNEKEFTDSLPFEAHVSTDRSYQ